MKQFYNITVIGAGYVGLVTSACLASIGHTVYCFDIDINKIQKLKLGDIYIHEPTLSELIIKQIKLNKLVFTNDLQTAVNAAEVFFIAVGTPQEIDGKANLQFVEEAILQITALFKLNDYRLIVIKSTVPVGTCRVMYDKVSSLKPDLDFDIASNPEFLREGSAVFDFINPDRIVIGVNKQHKKQDISTNILKNIYKHFLDREISVLFNDLESAELIKYASNCFLSVKIAFINELADFCVGINKALGTCLNTLTVAHAMGLDPRIGSQFLQPGPGFGGSCFPKDTLALDYFAKQYSVNLSILSAAIKANRHRIKNLSKKIINICRQAKIGSVSDKTIAILGIAFKANTDDIRDSPAITVVNDLRNKGALLRVYDPQAVTNGKIFFKDLKNIFWLDNLYDAVANSDLVVILTEWPEFINVDLVKFKNLMKSSRYVVIDFRNLFCVKAMHSHGFDYYSMTNGRL